MLVSRFLAQGGAVGDAYYTSVHSVCFLPRDDAETARDLLQDTFCDAWKRFGRGVAPFTLDSGSDGVRHWLFHVAYHRAISALRRNRLIRCRPLDYEHAPDLFALPNAQAFEDALAERDLLDNEKTLPAVPS